MKARKDDEEDRQSAVSWKQLLLSRGPKLWSLREQAFETNCKDEGARRHSNQKNLQSKTILPIGTERLGNSHKTVLNRLTSSFLRPLQRGRQYNSIDIMGRSEWVCVFTNVPSFCEAEETLGMDKRHLVSDRPKPLTECTGEEWKRQRECLLGAFTRASILTISWEAAESVDLQELKSRFFLREANRASLKAKYNASSVYDLKGLVQSAALKWIVRMFLGGTTDNLDLETSCFEYWQQIRCRERSEKKIRVYRQKFIGSLERCARLYHDMGETAWTSKESRDSHNTGSTLAGNSGGVLKEFYHPPSMSTSARLSFDEATANCINAMIAAFDAVQSIVFWTIWNLSKDYDNENGAHKSGESRWSRCRKEVLQMMKASEGEVAFLQEEADRKGLSDFKKQATEGKLKSYEGMSFLACSIAETVRVYPPVWTLPRTYVSSSSDEDVMLLKVDGMAVDVVSSKLDVPTVNDALGRQWNPDRHHDDHATIASFGVGRRHCPAGTAALLAAYSLTRQFVVAFASVDECTNGHALEAIYLGPTLCVEGKQLFHLKE